MQSKHRLHKWHVLFNYFFVFVNLVSLRVHSFMTSTKCKTGQLPPPYHPQPSNFGLTPPFPRHAYLVSVPPPPCGGIMFWNFLKKKWQWDVIGKYLLTGAFMWILRNFWEQLFYRTPPVASSESKWKLQNNWWNLLEVKYETWERFQIVDFEHINACWSLAIIKRPVKWVK